MKSPLPLAPEKLTARLAALPGWKLRKGKLHRVFTFKDFSEAFGFMARVALLAEKVKHHPDWSNSWNKVTVDLTTHDAGGVTELDAGMALEMSKIAGPKLG